MPQVPPEDPVLRAALRPAGLPAYRQVDGRILPAVRSHRELWRWLGALLLALSTFLAAIAIAYFIKESHYTLFLNLWMVGAGISFLLAFTCFFGAIENWPFPPWLKPKFPNIGIEIYGTGFIDTERDAGTGMVVPTRLRSFNARVVNLETEQDANVTVLLYVKLIPGSWGRAGEFVCPPPDWALSPTLSLSPMSMPVVLSPGSAIGGHLIYEIPSYYLDKIAEPMNARLELWDHISEKRMNIRAEMGNYDRSEMVPSSGEVETLGRDFHADTALERDAGQVQS